MARPLIAYRLSINIVTMEPDSILKYLFAAFGGIGGVKLFDWLYRRNKNVQIWGAMQTQIKDALDQIQALHERSLSLQEEITNYKIENQLLTQQVKELIAANELLERKVRALNKELHG